MVVGVLVLCVCVCLSVVIMAARRRRSPGWRVDGLDGLDSLDSLDTLTGASSHSPGGVVVGGGAPPQVSSGRSRRCPQTEAPPPVPLFQSMATPSCWKQAELLKTPPKLMAWASKVRSHLQPRPHGPWKVPPEPWRHVCGLGSPHCLVFQEPRPPASWPPETWRG